MPLEVYAFPLMKVFNFQISNNMYFQIFKTLLRLHRKLDELLNSEGTKGITRVMGQRLSKRGSGSNIFWRKPKFSSFNLSFLCWVGFTLTWLTQPLTVGHGCSSPRS